MQAVLCEELIGRDDALAVARAALDGVLGQQGRLLFVTGEAGVGKSRLTREIIASAHERGLQVLFGRAVPAEVPVPFRPMVGALLSHFRSEGPLDAPGLEPFRPALGQLLPEWRVGPGTAPEPIMVVAEALVRLLHVVAGSTGCLLVLEDLHWADPETLAVLEYFADALVGEPVMVVGTVRTEETGPARQLVNLLDASRSASVVELEPLSAPDLERMTSVCLGVDRVADEALDFIRDWSDGLPFMVEELLAGAIGVGALARDGDRWSFDSSAGPMLPVTFADNVRGRLVRLGADGRRVLEHAAVLGRRFDWSLLPSVTGLTDVEVLSALRAGVAGQLLAAKPGAQFEFRHALTRDAVLEDLLPAERAQLAGLLFGALQSEYVGFPGEWCEIAAELAERSGQVEQAAPLLLELGRRALASGALGSAEQILDRAGRSAPAVMLADIDEVTLDVLALAGKTDEAIAVGSRLAERIKSVDGSAARSANAHLGVARAAATACRWGPATSHLEQATIYANAAGEPVLAARISGVAATVSLGGGDVAVTVAQAQEALSAAERLGIHDLACEMLEVIGRCHRVSDSRATAQAFERALTIAETHDLPLWRARAMAELGTLDQLAHAGSDRLERARELALACGAWSLAAHVDLSLGQWSLDHFDSDQAVLRSTSSAELAQRLGLTLLYAMAIATKGLGHAIQADGGAAEADFAVAEANAAGDPAALGLTSSGRGLLALLVEDRESAKAHFERAAEQFARLETSPPVPTRAVLVLLLVQDDPDSETTSLARVSAEAAGLRAVHTIARAYLTLADAVELGRAGEATRAEAAFDSADRALADADGWRHYAYRLVAPDAIVGRWGDPVRWLREALVYFESKELMRVADACRLMMRSVGVPIPRRGKAVETMPGRLGGVGVTAREAEVLDLLGQGLTNQQMAERLFLSARTVERHLANVASKVGTQTRSELVALAARARP